MIGRQSGQWELPAWGIEHKPGLLDRINESLRWQRFDALLQEVFKASQDGEAWFQGRSYGA